MAEHKYYFDHETAYQQFRAKGEVGWLTKDRVFRDLETEERLQPFLAKYFPKPSGLTALDVGCGSGPTAHFLTDYGFKTTGIDISPTALEMAAERLLEEGKDIEFLLGDAVELHKQGRKFDLIYDSHCFHCIVTEDDRSQMLRSIRNCIAPGGFFILDTMVFRASSDICSKPDPLRFDENFILWHRTKKNWLAGVVEKDGELWCPQRRVYPAERILDEISAAGMKILEHSIVDQGPTQVYELRAVCTTA